MEIKGLKLPQFIISIICNNISEFREASVASLKPESNHSQLKIYISGWNLQLNLIQRDEGQCPVNQWCSTVGNFAFPSFPGDNVWRHFLLLQPSREQYNNSRDFKAPLTIMYRQRKRGRPTDIQWGEINDTANILQCTRQPPTKQIVCSSQNVSSVQANLDIEKAGERSQLST